MLLHLGVLWNWIWPSFSSDYYWRLRRITLNPTLFDRQFCILQLLLKPFLRKFARKMVNGAICKIILLYNSFTKLIWRNFLISFSEKSWDKNLWISTLCILCTHSVVKWKIHSHLKNISSKQLFSNFFSKNGAFTKFLPKNSESKFPELPHCVSVT